MKLLLDTNIFLEVMLGQSKAADARKLLAQTDKHNLHLTDFSLHSIGCYLFNRKKHSAFKLFFRDMVVIAGVRVISLSEHTTTRLPTPQRGSTSTSMTPINTRWRKHTDWSW